MRNIKPALAAVFVAAICLSSTMIAFAQNTIPSPAVQGSLSQIKDKRRIFVDVQNKDTKREVENFFRKDTGFEVVQNSSDADFVYFAATTVDKRPAFGTVEKRQELPAPAASRDLTGVELRNLRQFSKTEFEYIRKTSAAVYFNAPGGKMITVWAEKAERITNQNEPGGFIERFLKAGEELPLAKEFLDDLKDTK